MSIDAIAPIGADVLPTADIAPQVSAVDFMHSIAAQVGQADASLRIAEGQLTALAAGKDVAVHDVMIAMEEARTNMMFLVEVRNRMVEAYQELARMQL
jgi:flagellar hook-basal body complex protein FliE